MTPEVTQARNPGKNEFGQSDIFHTALRCRDMPEHGGLLCDIRQGNVLGALPKHRPEVPRHHGSASGDAWQCLETVPCPLLPQGELLGVPGGAGSFLRCPGGSGGNSTALVSSRALVVFALQQARSSGSGRVVIGSSGTFWWDVRGRTGIPRRPPESVIPGSAMGNPVSGPRQGVCLLSGRQLPLPTVMTRLDHLSLARWGILNAPTPAMLPGDYTSWKKSSIVFRMLYRQHYFSSD